jgi:hypothetical protein
MRRRDVSVLSRTATLAIAAETTPGTYTAPAFTVTFTQPARYHQVITPLRDLALRGSDSQLEDLLQGPAWSEWEIPSDCYPDLLGWYLRALIGPDACAPGVTTALASSARAGAMLLALGAAPAPDAVLMVGAGDTLEYVRITTPAGTSCPTVTPLRFAHAAGEPVLSQSVHVFTQQQLGPTFAWPRYSLTMDDGTGALGWPGCVFGSLQIIIGMDGIVKLRAACNGFPPAMLSAGDVLDEGGGDVMDEAGGDIGDGSSSVTYDATAAQPVYGWAWQITQGSGSSTRGAAMELTLHRELQITPTVSGQQQPLGIWPGPLQADGIYTALFEDEADILLYQDASQAGVTHSLVQPVLAGGCSVALSMPRAGWWDGEADPSAADPYLAAKFRLSGIAQPAGGAAFTATLTNFYGSAYS